MRGNSLSGTYDFQRDKYVCVSLNENKWMMKRWDIDDGGKGISKSRAVVTEIQLAV